MRTEKEFSAFMPFSSCRQQMHMTKSAHNAEKVCAQGMSKHVYCDSREKHQKRQLSAYRVKLNGNAHNLGNFQQNPYARPTNPSTTTNTLDSTTHKQTHDTLINLQPR